MSVEVVTGQYIAISKYIDGVPVTGNVVSADDRVAAMMMFDLMGEKYVDVLPYVGDDKLFEE